MQTPQFLIAKYVPDLRRMEPRNIGIILWSGGQVAARFAGENESADELTGCPPFLAQTNRPVYQDWIAFWRDALASETLRTSRGSFSRSDSSFVQGLKSTARENYVLADGGFLLSDVDTVNLQAAADVLFRQLVSDTDNAKPDVSAMLDKGWNKVITRAGLKGNPHFHPHTSVRGRFHHVEREYKFTAVIGNGSPRAALQKVSVSSALSVNNASLMFDGLLSNNWQKNRCVVFYYGDETALATDEVQLNLRQLSEVSTTINVIRPRRAVVEYRKLGIELSANGAG